jgi:prepilin-type N-terminal cleavage/methylation domain-containing protein
LPSRRVRTFARARAFTLFEVLLVLALMALLATVLIPGANSMLSAMNDRGGEQQIAETILAARSEALESGRTVDLRFDAEKRQLVWGATGQRSEPLPVGTAIEFLPFESGTSILLGGQLGESVEPLKRVRFFPDGTCDSFRVRYREPEPAKPRLYVIDPWTCALNPVAVKGAS